MSYVSGFSFKFHIEIHPWVEGGEKLEGQLAVSILEAGGCYCLVQLDLPFVEKSLTRGVFLKKRPAAVL
jgi:hypothetical protein